MENSAMTSTPSPKGRRTKRTWLVVIIGIELACIAVAAVLILIAVPDISVRDINAKEWVQEAANLQFAPYVPDLTPQQVLSVLGEEGYQCDDRVVNEAGQFIWRCQKTEGRIQYQMLLLGRTSETVDLIDANVNQSERPSDDAAGAYLCWVAGLPYGGETPDEVCAWITETLPTISEVDDMRVNEFNGLHHLLYGAAAARSLELGRLP